MNNVKTPKMDEHKPLSATPVSTASGPKKRDRKSNAEIRAAALKEGFEAGRTEGFDVGKAEGLTQGREEGATEARRFLARDVLGDHSQPWNTNNDHVYAAFEKFSKTARAAGMRQAICAIGAHFVLRNKVAYEDDPDIILRLISLFTGLAEHGAAELKAAEKKASNEKKAAEDKAVAEKKAKEDEELADRKRKEDEAVARLVERTAEKVVAATLLAFVDPLLGNSERNDGPIDPEFGMTAREKNLTRGGDKIAAIKMIRARTGLGLLEAKNIVDRYSKKISSPLMREHL